MDVDLDVALPFAPCHFVSLDIEDDMLGHFVNIGSVRKDRLNPAGDVIGHAYEVISEKNPYEASKKAL